MKISKIQKNELFYKLETVRQFLIFNNGYEHKLYNHTCPDWTSEPDDNIVGYLDDIEYLISLLIYSLENIDNN